MNFQWLRRRLVFGRRLGAQLRWAGVFQCQYRHCCCGHADPEDGKTESHDVGRLDCGRGGNQYPSGRDNISRRGASTERSAGYVRLCHMPNRTSRTRLKHASRRYVNLSMVGRVHKLVRVQTNMHVHIRRSTTFFCFYNHRDMEYHVYYYRPLGNLLHRHNPVEKIKSRVIRPGTLPRLSCPDLDQPISNRSSLLLTVLLV